MELEDRTFRLAMTAAYLLEYWARQQKPIPLYAGLIQEIRNARAR